MYLAVLPRDAHPPYPSIFLPLPVAEQRSSESRCSHYVRVEHANLSFLIPIHPTYVASNAKFITLYFLNTSFGRLIFDLIISVLNCINKSKKVL